MKNITWFTVFLAFILIGCSQQAQIESTEIREYLSEEAVAENKTSESKLMSIEFIPVDIWAVIDVKQTGKVTATDFVDYYVIKAQEGEKLSGKEAYAKFKILDRDSNGELTKEEATGKK